MADSNAEDRKDGVNDGAEYDHQKGSSSSHLEDVETEHLVEARQEVDTPQIDAIASDVVDSGNSQDDSRAQALVDDGQPETLQNAPSVTSAPAATSPAPELVSDVPTTKKHSTRALEQTTPSTTQPLIAKGGNKISVDQGPQCIFFQKSPASQLLKSRLPRTTSKKLSLQLLRRQ